MPDTDRRPACPSCVCVCVRGEGGGERVRARACVCVCVCSPPALNLHLVFASLRQILHPLVMLIRILLVHLQESYLHTGGRPHRHLEIYRNRRSCPLLFTGRRQQRHHRIQIVFRLPLESTNTPHQGTLSRFIFRTSLARLERRRRRRRWHGDTDDDPDCFLIFGEIGRNLQVDGQSRFVDFDDVR